MQAKRKQDVGDSGVNFDTLLVAKFGQRSEYEYRRKKIQKKCIGSNNETLSQQSPRKDNNLKDLDAKANVWLNLMRVLNRHTWEEKWTTAYSLEEQ